MTPCGGPAGVEADKIRTELGINYHMVRKESADPKLTVSCGPHCRNTIMKLTKNAAALLLAASLAVSVCATPVFAADATHTEETKLDATGSSKTTTVEYKVTEGYTWAIPAKIDFGSNAGPNKKRTVVAGEGKNGIYSAASATEDGSSGKVYVSGSRLKPGAKLTISISSSDYETSSGFFVKMSGGSSEEKLYYAIYKEKVPSTGTPTPANKLANNAEILHLDAGTDADSQDLTFILATALNGEKAGDYVGTVTFAASIT